MDLNPELPKDCQCKPLLKNILRDLKSEHGNAIKSGLVSDEMIKLMVKALAWEHLGKAAAFLQCGPHIEPALRWLSDAILREPG